MPILQTGFQVVSRTAQHGLIESSKSDTAKEKWFYVWCGDIAGELGEVMKLRTSSSFSNKDEDSKEFLTEIGDVLWGVCALAMLNGLDADSVRFYPVTEGIMNPLTFDQCLLDALELLDYGKKICRDGIAARPIDVAFVQQKLALIYNYLRVNYDTEIAIELVDTKLLKRYPNGFNAKDSVNRVV